MTTSTALWIIITSNLASSLIGWLLGRTARNTAKLVSEVEAVADEPGVSEETKGKLRRITSKIRPMHMAMVLLVVVGAVTTLVGFIGLSQSNAAQERADRAIECVTDFSNRSADALEARAQASAEAQEQVDSIFATVARIIAKPTEQSGMLFRNAISGYNQARRDQRVALERNPYPEAPRDACRDMG